MRKISIGDIVEILVTPPKWNRGKIYHLIGYNPARRVEVVVGDNYDKGAYWFDRDEIRILSELELKIDEYIDGK